MNFRSSYCLGKRAIRTAIALCASLVVVCGTAMAQQRQPNAQASELGRDNMSRVAASATELKAVWLDREFDANCAAAYYLRVMEIPSARWSTLLAIKNDLPLSNDAMATVQQRGWSSPIWYTPRAN